MSPGMFEDYLTTLNTAWVYPGSGEGYVYEFAVNLQTLNYLQTINLLHEDKLAVTLEYMQTSINDSCFKDFILLIVMALICSSYCKFVLLLYFVQYLCALFCLLFSDFYADDRNQFEF